MHGPLVVLACAPSDDAVLELIALGLALAARHCRISYLGAATPVDALRSRAGAIASATGATAAAMDALPGAGSAPGTTIPSYGVVLAGDHLARLRAHPTPVIARTRDGATFVDLRAVEPDDDAEIVAAIGASDTTSSR